MDRYEWCRLARRSWKTGLGSSGNIYHPFHFPSGSGLECRRGSHDNPEQMVVIWVGSEADRGDGRDLLLGDFLPLGSPAVLAYSCIHPPPVGREYSVSVSSAYYEPDLQSDCQKPGI